MFTSWSCWPPPARHICFAAFFFLIDYASRLLRPISILAHVGATDSRSSRAFIPPQPSARHPGQASTSALRSGVISHQGTSGIILAVNLDLLKADGRAIGRRHRIRSPGRRLCRVDEPLFNLYFSARSIVEATLRASVALGSERTMDQDPTFAFRIVIDIALKALSPAINDPTTAVLAIDQLHRMLRLVGERHLRTDELLDNSGRLRVIFRTPNWEEFVHLAFSEIRRCGSNNLQVVRRLRAMIENLIQTLPAHRHAALA